jgi:hypothetical protein
MGAFSLERRFCPLRASKGLGKGLAPLFRLSPPMPCVTCEQGTLSDAGPRSVRSAEAGLGKEGQTAVFDGKAGPSCFKKASRA